MYQIAEENGVENLVAGAWGCGVFMQDPYTVATLLIGAARNYNIPIRDIFALTVEKR